MKVVFASMTAAIALSTAAVAQQPTSAIATTDLNLRANPGANTEVLAVIPAEGEVAVSGCLDVANWCEVTFDGNTGWAYGDYLSVQDGDTLHVISNAPETIQVPVIKVEERSGDAAFTLGTVGLIAGAAIGGPVGALAGGTVGAGIGEMTQPNVEVETYIAEHPAAPVYVEGEVVQGATLPEQVELMPIPDSEFVYANVNNVPVVVEPGERKVIYIVR
ncbi:DUF1236 domain-containing protein [Tropicimonas sp. IMCC6043]|uniref:DUF1236 domain-containing protein n=1 Tax=Tropicimonas sp. IMCC6043 TaxID=2510645 RepID=UPI00101B9F91|nr:DUF1236 domain-containing protein [Tropicimonas sp. IMCC6043]RYH11250.1 DUF1236 domain-containing protein [Tropicimonas sp. IMCC6043]